MAPRSYDQFCPLAQALDLLGERWTLLIVRDLLEGPRRYGDLQRGLPGIGTDLLTERLRKLEAAGVVRRRSLPAPASVVAYELTERGRELEPALFGLARFGLGLLEGASPPVEDPPARERFALLLRALFDPAGADFPPETWVFEAQGSTVAVTAGEGRLDVEPGGDPGDAVARFVADVPTLYEVIVGLRDPAEAVSTGALRVEGDPSAAIRVRGAFPVQATITAGA